MTNAPNPGNEPEQNSTPQPESPTPRGSWRQRLFIAFGVVLLLGTAGGITGAWIFIQRMLAPMVERNLTQLLNRPVEMGDVQRFSLNSLRFDSAALPATPTDPDHASVEAVEVQYNPLQLLLNRRLELQVTLIEPDAYIEQAADGRWVNLELKTGEPGPIKIELQGLGVRNADVVLVPRSNEGKVQPAVTVEIPRGSSQFLQDNELIRFQLQGQIASGGKFELQGSHFYPTSETNLQVTGQNVAAKPLGSLLPLPLNLQAGQVGGDLEIKLQPEQPLQLRGNATLDDVTAQVPQLPQPFFNTNGRLRFKGTTIGLEEVNTRFGQIPAEANGFIDLQDGFNLTAQTQSVQIKQVLQTFNIKSVPVPLGGEVKTALKVTGPLTQPVVVGEAVTTKPSRIDQITFRTIRTDFKLDTPAEPEEAALLTVSNLRAFPTIGGIVTGQGNIQLGEQGGVRFNLQANKVPAAVLAKAYGTTLPVPVGSAAANIQIFAPLDKPQNFRATGTARVGVAGGTVIATNLQVINNRLTAQLRARGIELARLADVPPQFSGSLTGEFAVSTPLDNFTLPGIRGSGSGRINLAGGTVVAENLQLSQGRWRTDVTANRVQIGRLFPQIPEPLQEPINATFALSGSLEDLSVAGIRGMGNATLTAAGGRVTLSEVDLKEGRWQARVQATSIQLGQLVPQLPPQLQSPFTGTFLVSGSLEEFSPSTINVSGSGRLNVGGGTVRISEVDVQAGRWQAIVAAESVRLAGLAPQLPPQFAGALTGAFNLSGSLEELALSTIRGRGNGRLNLAGGTIRASDIQLASGRWQADVQASSVQLGNLLPQLPEQFAGAFTGSFDLAGGLDQVALNQIQAQGQGILAVAGGTVTATNLQLSNGNLQAMLLPQGIELGRFGEQLQGTLRGKVDLAVNLDTLTPEAIARSLRADGQLTFSEGLSIIDRPLKTAFQWTGQGIQIQNATAEGLSASGFVEVNPAQFDQGLLAAVDNLNLDVAATDLNLEQLSAFLPAAAADVDVVGLADFEGTIAGTVTNPRVQGDLALADFIVSGLAFEPLLIGFVSTVPGQGVELNLQGNNDRIEVALGADYQPVSFDIQRGEAIATGTREGDILQVNAQNIPISLIRDIAPVPVAFANQPLVGNISGDLAINLNTFDVALNRVELAGPIFGDRLGNEVELAENRYVLSGNIVQTPSGPQFQGELNIEEGQLETLVAALQIVNLTDVSPTFNAPLDIAAVGMPEGKLQSQLRRFSEIEALLERQQQQEEQASGLPDLEELDGTFSGTVELSGSLASGINAAFDIRGEDWEWDTFEVNQALIQGTYQNGVLTLLPVRLQSGESFAIFSGTLGGETPSGQLRLENIPIASIRDVVNLPPAIGFTGSLDATALLSGSIANPQVRGAVTVTDATLNQEQIESIESSFSYNNARLNFSAESLPAPGAKPLLTAAGSIPYQLPYPEAVAPESDQLTLDINVEDEGLALLNILTRQQVAWEGGMGNVNLVIEGTFDQEQGRPTDLIAQGFATVQNATIASQVLPEPLTDVTGEIEFNFNQVDVKNLIGNFGGGQIVASGTIPIYQRAPQENPLTVNIGELALNLKGLYKGQLQESQVVLTGTVLNPVIGGEINLVNGVVPLPDQGSGAATGAGVAGGGGGESGIPIEFNDLEIELVRNVEIRKAPILNFLAQGALTLNGSLDNLQPQGEIELRRGQVNLFTTQFRLARGYENTAVFTPSQGLDPYLDVRLVASVAEASQRRLAKGPESAEIIDAPDFGVGRVQTVRIVANVEGPASELTDQLELTSTPARSEAEIVALLGGSFVDTLGRGDTTLGLANLAGSALLGNVSNIIGDALGLAEFRLFPTLTTDDERRTSTLGVAAEAGVDITDNISVSVLKDITVDDSPQLGLRYRLNDNVLLRGSTDFSGESRLLIEYENRF
ncbi:MULTISPECIES: translocation/assembly module TamB domain-containing protein [unclassified Coleofasciculus]|uniref:translocation/assembly module TamB domain-containing protein n=1 Tax=unclassified Coleofasciculus TaxID=2692782 RepID=UPI0018825964|nr:MULTISPECIES: translocation/assembly module TamB [unclassified Coleofasciculus]MBE9126370.1 translocation/assembly module TamB domain-containing protein [Coleofasciculus sp. LEGE 07081]MBE9150023.1 translocation/assembly module TamB domain-containing protein [Coleofasciculus sp. LEGE 07092]